MFYGPADKYQTQLIHLITITTNAKAFYKTISSVNHHAGVQEEEGGGGGGKAPIFRAIMS